MPRINNRHAFSQAAAIVTLIASDAALLVLALSLAYIIRLDILPVFITAFPKEVPSVLLDRVWLMLVISLACMAYEGLYTKRLSFWQEAELIVKAMTLSFLLIMAFISLGKLSGEVSRTILMLGYCASIVLVPVGRLATKTVLSQVGIGIQPILILGVGITGRLIAKTLARESFLGHRIVGFLDDDPAKRYQVVEIDGKNYPVLGGFRDSDRIIDKMGVRHLVVAAPGMPPHEMVGLVNRLQRRVASVTVIPDFFGVPVMGAETAYSFDEQLLSLRIRNNLASPWNMIAKRIFDLLAGTVILVGLIPLMLVISLAIRADSSGSAFFTQTRIGRNGKTFKCFKYRTMVENNDEILRAHLENNVEARREWEQYAKLKDDDPRLTRVGAFIRRLSFDELPQIFNVIKGEMSLVGPRPYLPREQEGLGDYAATILMSRPGITGLWQVSGRNDIDFSGRLNLEAWYVRNWSLWLDITLLIRTIRVVLDRKGAY